MPFFVILVLFSLAAQPAAAFFYPNDPFYRNEWYLDKIGANRIWDKISTSPDVVVAVIDSGIQLTNPDLTENIWTNTKEIPSNSKDDDHNGYADDIHGWDFVTNTADPAPKFSSDYTETGISHGTMVAGIIGAIGNNAQGVTGVTWKTQIMPLRVLNEKGEGRVSDVIKAIDYAINNGADIINLSFVGFTYNENLRQALVRAYKAGIIVVAAAGNDQAVGSDGYNIDKTPLYPACYQGDNGEKLVIGVAATDPLDQKASFSSYGHGCIDISAPGVSFFNTTVYNPNFGEGSFSKYYDGYWSGTSMAAALVSGSLALLEQANPNLNHDDIIQTLLRSTDDIDKVNPGYAGQLGSGRLDLAGAINWALEKLNDRSGHLLLSLYATNDPRATFASHVNKITLNQADGQTLTSFNYSASKFGLNFASGNVDGKGQPEIIAALGPGGLPEVSVFSSSGKLLRKFLAYGQGYKGGVNVASGDVNGDGRAEIITAPESGSEPLVKIFDQSGKLLKSFLELVN